MTELLNVSGLLLMLCGVNLCDTLGYKPVIIVHGLFDGPKQFVQMARIIEKAHPGTNVSVIDLYDNMASLTPLWKQVLGFKKALYPIIQEAKNGVHLICFSQGGLICRGLLSTLPDHNVQSFISLSSPQAGQYGDTAILNWLFPHYLKAKVFHICYSSIGQELSICNFWNDPHQKERFLKTSKYLALLNGEKPHSKMTVWRENFLRISKLVLIGGPDDGVITPWESSQFGFYDNNETIVEMKNQNNFEDHSVDIRRDFSSPTFHHVLQRQIGGLSGVWG
uniref:palmitoyl-CoA hydrolase n=1 Tax=Esox lucius TaxID=8010 RepID=A0A3P8YGZ1_ESOLU